MPILDKRVPELVYLFIKNGMDINKVYSKLGGNGSAARIMEQVKKLPTSKQQCILFYSLNSF